MPLNAWISILVTLGCLLTLVFTRIGMDLVLLAGLTLLMLVGAVSPSLALSGFSNESVLTIAALYVVAGGLRETGALAFIVRRLFGQPGSTTEAQARMMLPVSFLGAFMNNTPLVAAFLPYVSDWARHCRISPSKLMIPLSYAAIFGGTCTIIGTSTNLVVNGLLTAQAHYRSMGFFELAWVGVPCALIGITYVLIFSRWLLPDRIPAIRHLQDVREYTVEMLVEAEVDLLVLETFYNLDELREAIVAAGIGHRALLNTGCPIGGRDLGANNHGIRAVGDSAKDASGCSLRKGRGRSCPNNADQSQKDRNNSSQSCLPLQSCFGSAKAVRAKIQQTFTHWNHGLQARGLELTQEPPRKLLPWLTCVK